LVNNTLNCHVVGFDIGCHEAILTFNDKFNVVEVKEHIHVIMPHDSQCQNQPHDSLM